VKLDTLTGEYGTHKLDTPLVSRTNANCFGKISRNNKCRRTASCTQSEFFRASPYDLYPRTWNNAVGSEPL